MARALISLNTYWSLRTYITCYTSLSIQQPFLLCSLASNVALLEERLNRSHTTNCQVPLVVLSLEINHLPFDLSISQCDWCGLLLTHPSVCSVPGTVLAVHLCELGQERVFEPTDVWIRTSTDTLETQATWFTLPQMTMLTGS